GSTPSRRPSSPPGPTRTRSASRPARRRCSPRWPSVRPSRARRPACRTASARPMPLLDQTLPAFELTEADGGRVPLAALVHSGPVVLAALDGERPCEERASMLAELSRGAAELGAELVVVAPADRRAAPAPVGAAGRWMTDAGEAFAALELVHRRLGR